MSQHTHTQVEEWRDIPGWEGYYQASSHGRVKSVDRVVECRDGTKRNVRNRILMPVLDEYGYQMVCLCKGGECQSVPIHRLVLEAFEGPRPEGMQGCHNDGDSQNNDLINLRWGTPSSNIMDTVIHGTHNNARKTHCPRGHELTGPNLMASQLKRGYRSCLACNRASSYVRRNPHRKADREAVANKYYQQIATRKAPQ